MSDKVIATAQQLDQPARIELFEIDLLPLGSNEILRFTSAFDGGSPVSFGGNVYEPRPVEVTGIDLTTDGPMPTPTLTMSNAGGVATQILLEHDDLVGAILKRIVTYEEFLDDGADPDSAAIFEPDYFEIDRKVREDHEMAQLELSSVIDQESLYLPGRQVLQGVCSLIYRRYDADLDEFIYQGDETACPYTGTEYFDGNNQPCAKSEDYCNKQITACQARFGDNTLPFSGFPGAAKVRRRN